MTLLASGLLHHRKEQPLRGGGSDGVRRLAALARYTTQESWGVSGMSMPWGDAERVG
jgi:hypothetical protein